MQDSDSEIEPHQQESMQSRPSNIEAPKPQKSQSYVNQIQKKILKPGAGKNSYGQKKGPSKYGLFPSTKISKNKNKAPEPQIVLGGNLKTQPSSSSRNKKILLQDNMILQDMRRLHQDQIQGFEASKIASKNLESFVVKNLFLTQNPPFVKKDELVTFSKMMEGDGILKKKPPDIRAEDPTIQTPGTAQVKID
ncbi:hypothetical protein PIB30_014735 [Stylosanthes scabra]|uniref:Uncharacterized protein n=1 Tax=Stylosanthes scabra TaxID=79078 RepID=A0ABU6X8B6_9FABA|nr:hypothetical protein [Stylosanthes scabra]